MRDEDEQSASAEPDANGNGNGHTGNDVQLAVMHAKLDIVISKVALLERDEENIWDKLEEVRVGQVEIVNGQKALLKDLTNAVLELKQTVSSQHAPLKRRHRYALAFTGGIAGGLAGGALMTLVLKVGAAVNNPVALTLLDLFR